MTWFFLYDSNLPFDAILFFAQSLYKRFVTQIKIVKNFDRKTITVSSTQSNFINLFLVCFIKKIYYQKMFDEQKNLSIKNLGLEEFFF